jgi:hypothetical protein
MRLSGRYLIAVAGLFASLWLGEIVPDLVAGGASRSASTWQVSTNPVHVLDLAFFLPAVAISGCYCCGAIRSATRPRRASSSSSY